MLEEIMMAKIEITQLRAQHAADAETIRELFALLKKYRAEPWATPRDMEPEVDALLARIEATLKE